MGSLSFLAPLYLLGALAIAVPLALHLYRRRTEEVIEFSSIAWLQAVPVETQQRRQLRDWLLLALRVAALLLLASAFARPYLAAGETSDTRPVTVMAVDASASMAAPGVWPRAQQEALAVLDAMSEGEAVALVRFDAKATVDVAPTTDLAAVRRAVSAMQPGDGATALHAALRQAAELIGSRDGRLVLVSDLQQSGWERQLAGVVPESVAIDVRAIEGARGNLAIAGVSASSTSAVAGQPVSLSVSLRNFGVAQQQTTVTVQGPPGTVLATQAVTVAPQSAVAVSLPLPSLPAEAMVAIDDDEGMPSDNRMAWSSARRDVAQVTVLVATPGGTDGLYVERALEAVATRRPLQVSVIDGLAYSAAPQTGAAQSELLVVLGSRTLTRQGRARVKAHVDAGRPLLVTLGPQIDRESLREWLGRPLALHPDDVERADLGLPLVIDDVRHPVFRGTRPSDATFGDIPVARSARVSGLDGWRVLARVSDGVPVLLESEAPGARVLLWASDFDQQWNRFPLAPAFVPFMADTVAYLLGQGMGVDGERTASGEGNPWPLSAEALLAAIPRGPRPQAPPPEVSARRLEAEQQWWQAGLLLMLTALVTEGWVGRRAR